jgi:hypothetical protein
MTINEIVSSSLYKRLNIYGKVKGNDKFKTEE